MSSDKATLTQIRLVNILDPICNYSVRNNEKIEFYDELFLLRAVIFCVPVVP